MCLNTELREYCNIITECILFDEEIKSPVPFAVYVNDTSFENLTDVVLNDKELFNEHALSSRECNKVYNMADRTSYNLAEGKRELYRVDRRRARYVLWPIDLPLTVCATCIEFLPAAANCAQFVSYMPMVLARAHEWAKGFFAATSTATFIGGGPPNRNFYKSIIVFDLDSTLIDPRDKIYNSCLRLLRVARELYDYVVLWSHGTTPHVHKQVAAIQRRLHILSIEADAERGVYDESPQDSDSNVYCVDKSGHIGTSASPVSWSFCDLVLSYDSFAGNRYCKNLLTLYNYFPNCKFDTCVLVDDSPYNWTPEYSKFIVAGYKKTCQGVLNHI